MTKTLALSILPIMFCFVFGCTYWYQPAKTYEQCDQDLRECYTTLQKYADMNSIAGYEVEFIKDCMKQKGYVLYFESELPSSVRRRDPRVDSFWLLAGVSGTVEK
jgi:hypothetical protein